MNKILQFMFGIVLLISLVIVLFFYITNNYQGSNAELPETSTYDAVLRCTGMFADNVTITWEYPSLNESDSLNAYKFALENDCEFKHKRFELNLTTEVINNGTENAEF